MKKFKFELVDFVLIGLLLFAFISKDNTALIFLKVLAVIVAIVSFITAAVAYKQIKNLSDKIKQIDNSSVVKEIIFIATCGLFIYKKEYIFVLILAISRLLMIIVNNKVEDIINKRKSQ